MTGHEPTPCFQIDRISTKQRDTLYDSIPSYRGGQPAIREQKMLQ